MAPRILLVRLQAIGDTVAALPIAAGLRAAYPDARLGLVTGARSAAVGTTSARFDVVHAVDLSGGRLARVLACARLGLAQRGAWDVVLDLQDNRESRAVRRAVGAPAHGVLDKFGPRHALDRYGDALAGAGLAATPVLARHVRDDLVANARARLVAEAPDADRFVLLNPGGLYPTRQWPRARWRELARRLPGRPAFVITGDARVAPFAKAMSETGLRVVDLVGRSSLAEGLAFVAACDLAISEDGALLHAAWCGGVPTVAVLGSVRSDWVRPLGPRARWFGSQDLPCGDCMAATCARGDLHCLTRVTVDDVLAAARAVLA